MVKVNKTGVTAGVITLVIIGVPSLMLIFPSTVVEFIAGIFSIVVICVAVPFTIWSIVYSWLGGE